MTDDAPIRLLKRRVGCENRIFEIFLDNIEEPGGEVVHDFLVLAPKARTGNLITGVATLPVVDGRFALLRIFRHPLRAYTWEAPRGFVDADEDRIDAALRELMEETGLECAREDIVDLGTVAPEPGIMAGRTHLFAATRCRGARAFEASELGHKELRLLEADEMAEMARSGAIEDANTLVAYFRYLGWCNGR